MRVEECIVAAIILCVFHRSDGDHVKFTVNTAHRKLVLDNRFLSFILDPADLLSEKDKRGNTQSIVNVMRKLAPAYLRVDPPRIKVEHDINDELSNSVRDLGNEHYSVSSLRDLRQIVNETGMDLVACLTSAQRKERINRDMSKILRQISQMSNPETREKETWQLGCDMRNFEERSGVENARDLNRVRNLLNIFSQFRNTKLVGPDITTIDGHRNAQEILDMYTSASSAIKAIPWQPRWPRIGMNNPLEANHRHSLLPIDYLQWDRRRLQDIFERTLLRKQLWISEPSRPSEFSSSFADALIYARRLILAAQNGVDVVFKHVRALKNGDPDPEYWVALLHKKFAGRTILKSHSIHNNTDFQAIVHCKKAGAAETNDGITIFSVNTRPTSQAIIFKGIFNGQQEQEVHQYVLQATDRILSRNITINDEKVFLDQSSSDIRIKPKVQLIQQSETVHQPGYSVMFWIFPHLKVESCNEELQQGGGEMEQLLRINEVSSHGHNFKRSLKGSDVMSRVRRYVDYERLGMELKNNLNDFNNMIKANAQNYLRGKSSYETSKIANIARDFSDIVDATDQEDEFEKFIDKTGLDRDLEKFLPMSRQRMHIFNSRRRRDVPRLPGTNLNVPNRKPQTLSNTLNPKRTAPLKKKDTALKEESLLKEIAILQQAESTLSTAMDAYRKKQENTDRMIKEELSSLRESKIAALRKIKSGLPHNLEDGLNMNNRAPLNAMIREKQLQSNFQKVNLKRSTRELKDGVENHERKRDIGKLPNGIDALQLLKYKDKKHSSPNESQDKGNVDSSQSPRLETHIGNRPEEGNHGHVDENTPASSISSDSDKESFVQRLDSLKKLHENLNSGAGRFPRNATRESLKERARDLIKDLKGRIEERRAAAALRSRASKRNGSVVTNDENKVRRNVRTVFQQEIINGLEHSQTEMEDRDNQLSASTNEPDDEFNGNSNLESTQIPISTNSITDMPTVPPAEMNMVPIIDGNEEILGIENKPKNDFRPLEAIEDSQEKFRENETTKSPMQQVQTLGFTPVISDESLPKDDEKKSPEAGGDAYPTVEPNIAKQPLQTIDFTPAESSAGSPDAATDHDEWASRSRRGIDANDTLIEAGNDTTEADGSSHAISSDIVNAQTSITNETEKLKTDFVRLADSLADVLEDAVPVLYSKAVEKLNEIVSPSYVEEIGKMAETLDDIDGIINKIEEVTATVSNADEPGEHIQKIKRKERSLDESSDSADFEETDLDQTTQELDHSTSAGLAGESNQEVQENNDVVGNNDELEATLQLEREKFDNAHKNDSIEADMKDRTLEINSNDGTLETDNKAITPETANLDTNTSAVNKTSEDLQNLDDDPSSPWLESSNKIIHEIMLNLLQRKEAESQSEAMGELKQSVAQTPTNRRSTRAMADSSAANLQLGPGVYVVPTHDMTNVHAEQTTGKVINTKNGKPVTNVLTLNIYYDKKLQENLEDNKVISLPYKQYEESRMTSWNNQPLRQQQQEQQQSPYAPYTWPAQTGKPTSQNFLPVSMPPIQPIASPLPVQTLQAPMSVQSLPLPLPVQSLPPIQPLPNLFSPKVENRYHQGTSLPNHFTSSYAKAPEITTIDDRYRSSKDDNANSGFSLKPRLKPMMLKKPNTLSPLWGQQALSTDSSNNGVVHTPTDFLNMESNTKNNGGWYFGKESNPTLSQNENNIDLTSGISYPSLAPHGKNLDISSDIYQTLNQQDKNADITSGTYPTYGMQHGKNIDLATDNYPISGPEKRKSIEPYWNRTLKEIFEDTADDPFWKFLEIPDQGKLETDNSYTLSEEKAEDENNSGHSLIKRSVNDDSRNIYKQSLIIDPTDQFETNNALDVSPFDNAWEEALLKLEDSDAEKGISYNTERGLYDDRRLIDNIIVKRPTQNIRKLDNDRILHGTYHKIRLHDTERKDDIEHELKKDYPPKEKVDSAPILLLLQTKSPEKTISLDPLANLYKLLKSLFDSFST